MGSLPELCEPEISWKAPDAVRALVQSLGRTEDVRFSPSNRRLALAGLLAHRIVVCDIELTADGAVTLPRAVAVTSPAMNLPHGVDFIDDDTIAVASRGYGISLFRMPAGTADARIVAVDPIRSLPMAGTPLLRSPGSVSIVDQGHAVDILVCNNTSGVITRHRVAGDTGRRVDSGEALVGNWLELPDGVTVSGDRHWLAVSDHGSHVVQVYSYRSSTMADSDPECVLRGVYFPHGLRFTADSRHMLVADAGTPFVWVFAQGGPQWSGLRHPLARVRVMDDALFAHGDVGPGEGGPKGIDIDASGQVLAVAAKDRPLAFFDFRTIMNRVEAAEATRTASSDAGDIRYELHALKSRRDAAVFVRDKSALLTYVVQSASWRMTEPLRRLHGWFRGSK